MPQYNYLIGTLRSENGIQRDGTAYASKAYIDGQWVRFYENRPRKMGGCVLTSFSSDVIIRSMLAIPKATGGIFLYTGKDPIPPVIAGSVEYIEIDIHGVASGAVDRTPVDWPIDTNLVVRFYSGNFFEVAGGASHNIVFANPNKNDLSDTTEYTVYAGRVDSTAPLTPLYYDGTNVTVKASGGVLVCPPVVVAYGTDGVLQWSKWDGTLDVGGIVGTNYWPADNKLNVARTKIIKAINTLGGTVPTILLWSFNALYRATFIDNPDTTISAPRKIFVSTTVHSNISIMAPNSVVIYDQLIFWIGVDQFYVYNGIVQSLKNTMNNDWFFNSVNQDQRAKIWGVAVPRTKEIWWYYPRGTAIECNAVIIYNVELNVWYDNTIPDLAPGDVYPWTRSAGVGATGNYPFPLYADNTLVSNPSNPSSQTYPIWTHEQGVDRRIEDQRFAINSFYTTSLIDLWEEQPANSNLLLHRRIVPDFEQLGEMSVQITNLMYPHSVPTQEGPLNFTQNTEYVDFASQGALSAFTFRSNVVGGDYIAGKSLYFYSKGDTLK